MSHDTNVAFLLVQRRVGKKKNQRNQKKFMPTKSDRSPSGGGLKLKEAAQYIGNVSVPTMHRLVKRGLLRPNRTLRHLIFTRDELDRFLRDGMT
jgi:hypothetical protein